MRGRWPFWLVVFAGWSVLVVVFAVSSSLTYALNYQPPRWRYTLTMAATEWYVWAALTPLITWLCWRVRNWRWWSLLIVAGAGVFVAFFKVTLTRVLRGAIGGGDEYFQITNLVIQYLIFWAIVLAARGWRYHLDTQQRELRTSQLEALLAQTRLQMLSMQLQPHFLFNALNTIAVLMREDVEAAERVLVRLSSLLRRALDTSTSGEVSLRQELVLLDAYLEVERARYGDRLAALVEVPDELLDARIPDLLAALREDDLLILTGDHGCDPSDDSTDHTREYVPLIASGRKVRAGALGDRSSFSDIAATLAENFDLAVNVPGDSFLRAIAS